MNYDKRNFTEEEIKKAVSESYSYATLAQKLGYNNKTGHYVKDVEKWLKKYNCDTSHFKGRGWNKGNYDLSKITEKKVFRGQDLLKLLIEGFDRPRKCEKCGNTEWEGLPIPLQVHHIDGNHYNNELDNLQILCPNCHAQTDNFCGRGTSKRNISDEEFITSINNSYSIYEALRKIKVCDIPAYRNRAKNLIQQGKATLLIKVRNKENRAKAKNKENKNAFNFNEEQKQKFEERKQYFLSDKIDTTKFGWQAQAERDLGISHTQIRRWLNKYMPELNVLRRK